MREKERDREEEVEKQIGNGGKAHGDKVGRERQDNSWRKEKIARTYQESNFII